MLNSAPAASAVVRLPTCFTGVVIGPGGRVFLACLGVFVWSRFFVGSRFVAVPLVAWIPGVLG